MNPGVNVESPRSMTWAPPGTATFEPASMILSPWIITMAFGDRARDLPSNIRAALSAIVLSAASVEAIARKHAGMKRAKFMPAIIRKRHAAQDACHRTILGTSRAKLKASTLDFPSSLRMTKHEARPIVLHGQCFCRIYWRPALQG